MQEREGCVEVNSNVRSARLVAEKTQTLRHGGVTRYISIEDGN